MSLTETQEVFASVHEDALNDLLTAYRSDRPHHLVYGSPPFVAATTAAGDFVVWNCQSAKAVPFLVIGDKEFFASDRMINECGFSHAFGSAGDFRWLDANGRWAGRRGQ